jgi:uncharacterized repeat protein (TIGR01451 family)
MNLKICAGILMGLTLTLCLTYTPALADGPPICSNPNVLIPDATQTNELGSITDTITVPQTATLSDLNVSLLADHTWVSDLSFTLTHVETGSSATLIDRPGLPPGTVGCSGDNIDAVLDDAALTPAEDACNLAPLPAISGVLTPSTPLAVFAGESIAGTWQLTASDHDAVTTGTLKQWCLIPAPQADLALNKIVNQANPAENEVVTYTVTLNNLGPDEATGVVISDTLPFNLSFVSAASSQGSYSDATGLWQVGSLAASESATLTLAAAVAAGTVGQTLINTAEVNNTEQLDLVANNNADSSAISVTSIDLALSKTVDNPNPQENEALRYTVTVFNNGPDGATGVVINDTLPLSLTFVEASPSQGSYNSGSGAWTVGKMVAGKSATMTLTATVHAGTAGQTITNTATLAALEQTDSDASNDSASATIIVSNADLAVTKTVDNPSPKEGGAVVYTVSVVNNGPDDTTGVIVSDTLPLSLTLVGSEASQGGYDSSAGTWQVGDLLTSASATLTLTATVQLGTIGQLITNTATISASDQPDADLTNNSDDEVIRVSNAELAVTKTTDQTQPNETDPVVYTVAVNNNGPDDATGVVISDTLPIGLSLLSSTPSQGVYDSSSGLWQVGSLAANTNATLVLAAQVNSGTAGQILTNTAEISSSDQSDLVTVNNVASVPITVTNAELAVSKTVDNPNPVVNEVFNYTVTVSNNGPDDASGVVISDTLPVSLTLVSSSTNLGGYNAATGAWAVDLLPVNQSAVLTLAVTAQPDAAGQTITNTAQVGTADQGDSDSSNNSAAAPLTVVGANLAISKVSSLEAAGPGTVLTYTITVTNSGPSPATGVVVSDTLPAGLSFISVSPGSPTCAETGGAISCTLGMLNDEAVSAVTIVVSATTVGTVTNVARVSSNEADPTLSDNEAAAETIIGAPAPGETLMYLPIIVKDSD